MLYYSLLL